MNIIPTEAPKTLESCSKLGDSSSFHEWLHSLLPQAILSPQFALLRTERIFHFWKEGNLNQIYRNACQDENEDRFLSNMFGHLYDAKSLFHCSSAQYATQYLEKFCQMVELALKSQYWAFMSGIVPCLLRQKWRHAIDVRTYLLTYVARMAENVYGRQDERTQIIDSLLDAKSADWHSACLIKISLDTAPQDDYFALGNFETIFICRKVPLVNVYGFERVAGIAKRHLSNVDRLVGRSHKFAIGASLSLMELYWSTGYTCEAREIILDILDRVNFESSDLSTVELTGMCGFLDGSEDLLRDADQDNYKHSECAAAWFLLRHIITRQTGGEQARSVQPLLNPYSTFARACTLGEMPYP